MEWEVAPAETTAPPPEALETVASSGPPQPCEGALRLLGSVVVARQPERSVAMLSWQGRSHVVQVGHAIGDTQLLALRPAQAYLQPSGKDVCTLALFQPTIQRPAAPQPARGTPAQTKKAPKSGYARADLDAAIRSDWRESRAGSPRLRRECALGDPVKLAGGARFVPASRGPTRIGMRVYGVRRDTVLYRLGVRNGDVLRSINGISLADADGLLRAYTSLRGQSELSLSLYRRGAVTTLGVAIN